LSSAWIRIGSRQQQAARGYQVALG
jgi:hypothetical protein